MFKLYLKIAFRNMWKHRTQSLIGILGLAFAIACFVPSLFWIRYETSYDDFYPQADCIYRVYTQERQSGKINKAASKVIERTLREQFPVIEASTSVMVGDEKMRYLMCNCIFYMRIARFFPFSLKRLFTEIRESLWRH